jgi:hypothetical protein
MAMQDAGEQVDENHAAPDQLLSVGSRVRVRTDADHQSRGVIADDYGEACGTPIELGPNSFIAPARRWAVILDDGTLVFADSHDITVEEIEIASATASHRPDDAEGGNGRGDAGDAEVTDAVGLSIAPGESPDPAVHE